MSAQTMGRVLVTAKIENLEDTYKVKLGLSTPDQIRVIEVTDALVDTGATQLSMPKRLIEQLGLQPLRSQRARTPAGIVTVQIYDTVRITIQDRVCVSEVSELPDECPVLIGQLPLEQLDFVVDMRGHRLIGNPEHDGEQMIDLY